MKTYLNFFALSIAELINLFLGFKKVTFGTTRKLRLSYQEVILVLYWKSLVLELLSTSLICEHEHSRELTNRPPAPSTYFASNVAQSSHVTKDVEEGSEQYR